MEQSIRILIVEDSELDVQLMQRELQRARLSFLAVRTQTLEDFTQQLELFLPDIILADYTLPTFSGDEALVLARQYNSDIPFIFVTGTIGEEIAIETLKKGATDYVMKENLKRLGPAVMRALHETSERKAQARTEIAYKDMMNRYREIVENASDIIFTMDYKGYFLHVNQAGLKSCGYTIGEMWKTKYLDLILPDHRERVKRHYMRHYLAKRPVTYIEYPIQTKHGAVLWYAQNAVPMFDGENVVGFHVICRDVTEQKKQAELVEAKTLALDQLAAAVVGIDLSGIVLSWNAMATELLQWTADEMIGKNMFELIATNAAQVKFSDLTKGPGSFAIDALRKDGTTVSVKIESSKILNPNNELIGYVGVWNRVNG